MGTHEFHMTNHPGYDIKEPDAFLDKYGSYVLTVMYLVKYGAMMPGLIHPPLGQSMLVSKIKDGPDHLNFVKKNIGQLVDEMITYLEKTGRSIDSSTNTTSNWNLRLADLEELRSYLEIHEESFPSELYQSKTHERDYSWMCNELQFERSVRHLKSAVSAAVGTYHEEPGKIDIKVPPNNVTEELYNSIVSICEIQGIDDEPSLTVNCGRLSLMIDSTQAVRHVSATVEQLSDLTSDDIEFIQKCNLTGITELRIKVTEYSEHKDKYKLAGVLEQSYKAKLIHIRCIGQHLPSVISMVLSEKERALQHGKESSPQSLKLSVQAMNPGWLEYDLSTTLTFSVSSTKFDMDTYVKLPGLLLFDSKAYWISDFVHQYGWTVCSWDTVGAFDDHLATLLDSSTQIHGSRLTCLVFQPHLLTSVGLDALDRVIHRSRGPVELGLYLYESLFSNRLKNALLALGRFGRRLKSLTLWSFELNTWLPHIMQEFPTRSSFPKLDNFTVRGSNINSVFPRDGVQWLAEMISTPPQPQGSFSNEGSSTRTQQATNPSATLTLLKRLTLYNVNLDPQDWTTLLKAIDFSVLEHLDFSNSRFTSPQMDVLIECMGSMDVTWISLKTLRLTGTTILAKADTDLLKARIRTVAPLTEIYT
jgi:hypothetical protein